MNKCMKYLIGIPIVMMLLVSCEGPVGPQGEKGNTGNNGTNGIDGLDGVANIQIVEFSISSNSITVNGDWAYYDQNIPEITSEIMNGGVVLVYWYNIVSEVWFALPFVRTVDNDEDGQVDWGVSNNFGYEEGIVFIYWDVTDDKSIQFGEGTYTFKVVIIPPN